MARHRGLMKGGRVHALAVSWRFSLILLIAYIAAFHSWAWMDRSAIAFSGGLISLLLLAGLWREARNGYFVNRWDLAFHAAVIADLLAEALWVRFFTGYGFYLCAIGFALTVGGYRWHALRTSLATAQSPSLLGKT